MEWMIIWLSLCIEKRKLFFNAPTYQQPLFILHTPPPHTQADNCLHFTTV